MSRAIEVESVRARTAPGFKATMFTRRLMVAAVKPYNIFMKQRITSTIAAAFGGLVCGLGALAGVQAEVQRPNIVLIMADDLGWQDVGFNGSRWFETPNLDAMAAKSAVFKHACMYPTCSPSRTALMTGKHSFRTQVYAVPVGEKGNHQNNVFSRWTVEAKHPFYSKPLNEAGYRLIHLGKWHVVGPSPAKEKNYPLKRNLSQPGSGNMSWLAKHQKEYACYYPEGKGFHENVGGTFWGDPARGKKKGYSAPGGGYRAPYNNPFIREPEEGKWLTDHLTDEAMRFIGENKSQPFFVNLHYYSPHRPSVAHSDEGVKKYLAKAEDPVTGQHGGSTTEIAAYATMVENIDRNVGRLMRYLDEQKLSSNTVVIFTSDNGFNMRQSATRSLRGHKGTIYEGGIRVPSLIHWPEKIGARVVEDNVTVLDYFPTILDLAGVKDYRGQLDGDSLLPLATGQDMAERSLFWHVASHWKQPPVSMMKKGKWKLLQFLLSGEVELYNLESDPGEVTNLYQSHPDQAESMLAEMVAWRKANQVPLPPNSSLSH